MRTALVRGSLIALGVAFGYMATFLFAPRPDAPKTNKPEAPSATPVAQTGALGTRLSFVESQLTAMRARLESLGAAPAPAPAPDAHAAVVPEATPVTPAEELAQQKAAWHEHMIEVEAGYASEARDPRWAREAQTVITQALDGLPALSKGLRSMDCRSETCRVEVVNDHQPEFDKQLPLLPLGLRGLPSAEFDQVTEPDGKMRTVVYLTRQTDAPAAGG